MSKKNRRLKEQKANSSTTKPVVDGVDVAQTNSVQNHSTEFCEPKKVEKDNHLEDDVEQVEVLELDTSAKDSDEEEVEECEQTEFVQQNEQVEPQIALSEYLSLETKYAELQEQLLRLTAEYDNFRRRTRKEKLSIYEDATCDVVKAFLPVLDNMDRALAAANKYESVEGRSVMEGLELISRQIESTLEQLEVTETEGQGANFDPEQHNAVMHVEDSELADNVVKEVLEKGYRKNDRIIRHSSVIVAN